MLNEKEKEYLDLLNKRFEEEKYIDFIRDLLNLSPNDFNTSDLENKNISKQFENDIDYYKYIAKYNDGFNSIGIIIVRLKEKTSTNARTLQRNFIAKLLNDYNLDASLVAFYSLSESNWRLSFVKKELSFTNNGLKLDLTPARRYSYLVGENESVHTAQEYLLKLLKINDRKIELKDIEEVFDVEKVTKKFFEEYKEKYLQLKEELDNNEDFISESKKYDFTSSEFAKKLMGQIVFLYFLQKKGWLGVQLVPDELNKMEYQELLEKNDNVSINILNSFYELQDDSYIINTNKLKDAKLQEDIINLSNIFKKTSYDKSWGTGKKDFIRTIFKKAKKEHKNFFDDYLELFFYKGLNEKRENQYFPLFNCKIPFLNGGLFEPLNDYRWSSCNFAIDNSIFSNDDKDGILDFLDLYNFTIDEEEPLEKEIAVDPEMLGKIFENLLEVDDRKSKGAFYTPREIVYYMCQESIANYLVNKVKVNYNQIMEFIKYGDLIRHLDWEEFVDDKKDFIIDNSIYDNLLQIDEALINVKIADPAVGSGAFPLGILNEIVKLRDNITYYIMIQSELKILNMEEITNSVYGKRNLFDIKLQTIENCIYAVDSESSAVDITKLRLWLSLIVDYPNDEEPRPLPNLDCKIMQGNSLLDEFDGVKLFDEKLLENNLKKYNRNMSSKTYVEDLGVQLNLQLDSNDVDLTKYMDEILKFQKEYFITSDSKRKKELKSRIDTLQLMMIKETLNNNPDKLKVFEKEAKERNKPWFIWKLEFYDVFKNNGGFDIVIGNPPYVQLQKDGSKLANLYKNAKYEVFTSMADLYCLFYEKGYNILTNDGILCFITSNKWMRAGYGEKLRQFLSIKTNPLLLIDFAGNKVFDSATVDVNILEFSKHKNLKNTKSCTILDNYKNNLYEYIIKNCSFNKFNTSENWVILNQIETSIKNKIEKVGIPLSQWDVQINYGIKTGYNDAFIIDTETKEKLISADPKNAEIIRPILRGKDIKRYKYEFKGFYLIALLPSKKYNIDDYPTIKKYLLDNFGMEKLEQTGKTHIKDGKLIKSRKKTNNKWYETQDSISYWNDFNKQKIMYSEIVQEPKFFYDEYNYYPEATTFIMTGKNLKALIIILNSNITFKLFKLFYAGGGLSSSGVRYKKTFFYNLVLPKLSKNNIRELEEYYIILKKKEFVNIEKELLDIDNYVAKLYCLNEKEREYLINL